MEHQGGDGAPVDTHFSFGKSLPPPLFHNVVLKLSDRLMSGNATVVQGEQRMIAHCPSCAARYEIPEQHNEAREVRFKCAACGSMIRVVMTPTRTERASAPPIRFGANEVLPKGSIPPVQRRVVAPPIRPRPPLTPPPPSQRPLPPRVSQPPTPQRAYYGAPGALHTNDVAPGRTSTPRPASHTGVPNPTSGATSYTAPTLQQTIPTPVPLSAPNSPGTPHPTANVGHPSLTYSWHGAPQPWPNPPPQMLDRRREFANWMAILAVGFLGACMGIVAYIAIEGLRAKPQPVYASPSIEDLKKIRADRD